MTASFSTMRRQRLTYCCQLAPDLQPRDHHMVPADLPLTKLRAVSHGPRTAFVRHDRGCWPGRPGFARLHYRYAWKPSNAWDIAEVNTAATVLLIQPDTVYTPGIRPLGADEMVLAYAWVAYEPGPLVPYFTLAARHHDEVRAHIAEEMGEVFETHVHRGRLHVFPTLGDPAEYRAGLVDCDDLDTDEIDAMVSAYANFPVEARLRWG